MLIVSCSRLSRCALALLLQGVAPAEVMGFLNELFGKFDELVDTHNVHKVETAGE